MAKKQKQNKKALAVENKLDWHKFNRLENMLVFCALPEKSVPKESGVHFRITPNKDGDCVCLLFEIDRERDPLIREKIPRPDFLALYIDREMGCLLTIIEMKGTTLDGGKHAVEQITTFYDLLRREIRENLPNKLKPKFQAIILTPTGTDSPNPLIAKVSREKGFTIRPVQEQFKAELFDYVSQDVKTVLANRKAVNRRLPNRTVSNELKSLEDKLTLESMPKRKDDEFCAANKEKATNKTGVYINYALSGEESYAALAVDNAGMAIGVKESGDKFKNKIKSDLRRLGLKENQHFEIEKIN